MKRVLIALIPFLVLACESAPGKKEEPAAPATKEVVNPAENVPSERKEVKTEPVASYRVKTDDPLNDFFFGVELYETKKTFHYLMKLEFETIDGKDTLRLPNFGTMPEPVIKKGPEKFSAIIGFMDKDKQFREYKKVYVVGNKLKVTALKHYGVSTYQP
ncbi:hypothetical protein [Pseudobacter ginsenosidimutans]|uniref:Lipoprotein n=1 Tax=Pseudobacter ginsenosidimutans TaxID=661488 RepID=A0A4Q7N127_9BACT|nr:hypothetical protein [Pseudobacter ginsenosidimutans]QEC43880.1 hypothetical protein FSB84_20170 [Pseudobacter ginsenosidimutans]RZS75307.1 hypothetical protein EV199_1171 [Pseudobacter ginsenosidimutans]